MLFAADLIIDVLTWAKGGAFGGIEAASERALYKYRLFKATLRS